MIKIKLVKLSNFSMYIGNLYRCLSYPTIAGIYFAVTYKEKIVDKNKIFVKLKNGSYVELEDLKNGKNLLVIIVKQGVVVNILLMI